MTALAVSAALLLSATPLGARATTVPTEWDPIDFGSLTEIRSNAGLLTATLRAAPARISVGPASFDGMDYNGDYAGPVLHVRAGDLVHIRLVNALPDSTNLHFHGMRVSPLNHGDNMHLAVQPGGAIDYVFRVPSDHPPGLFWYHDHLHGMAERHVMAGLSGTLVVDGFARQFGGLDGIRQKLFVLKDEAPAPCPETLQAPGLHCRVLSVNGQAAFSGTMRPGETQLWRIANEGANRTLHLTLDGVQLRIIGRDGLPTTRAEDTKTLDIMPASRMDALVTAGMPGVAHFTAQHVLTGEGEHVSTSRDLGTVTIAGDAMTATAPTIQFPAQLDLRTHKIDATRTIVFSENPGASIYFIDGRIFDHARLDLRVPLGNVEEWTVQNKTQDFHEFHIHQLGFQVVDVNGEPQAFAGYVDDVDVPAMGEVKIILPFTDPVMVGTFMFHCHVLKHEDAGMMANIEVYRDGEKAPPSLCLFPHQGDASKE